MTSTAVLKAFRAHSAALSTQSADDLVRTVRDAYQSVPQIKIQLEALGFRGIQVVLSQGTVKVTCLAPTGAHLVSI